MDQSQRNTQPIAVLGAVSREFGMDMVMQFKNSVNGTKFLTFLDNLRAKYPFDDILLVMDNLAVHRSQATMDRMNELGFRWTWTPRYQPWYNGIEEVWAMSKRYIKQERLNAVLNGRNVNMK